jgi:hypothetical protein
MSRPPPQFKRVGPRGVPEISIGSHRYTAIHWGRERKLGQNGGYLSVTDAATGREIAVIKVYDIEYDEHMETDVQDVFITSIERLSDRTLVVDDERGRRYVVDCDTHAVRLLNPESAKS